MKILKILFFSLFAIAATAQQNVEGGVFAGFGNYQGDLSEDEIELSETKLTYGAFVRYHLKDKFKLRANLYYGFVSGNDQNAKGALKDRGWSFESSILELSLMGEYHPFGRGRLGTTGLFRKQVSPFIGAGVGLASFNPDVKVSKSEDANLFPEPSASSTSLSLPLMVGLRADLLEHFSLGLEWGWRFTFNDYIDGVSLNGNQDKNDLYVFIGLTASYFFGEAVGVDFQSK
jgi:opacity protein-like surface antigen